MPSEKLMPCPFCGGSIELRQMGDDKFVAILCENCQASGPNHYGKHEWNSRFTAAEQAEPAPTYDAPLGAIENGRVFLQRLVDRYDFQCEAGGLANCSDYHEVVRCFEAMAEWIYHHAPAARSGAVKVKPLEWVRGWMNAEAQTDIGLYQIAYRRDGSFEWCFGIKKEWASSWDAAKEAAQADYERRILAALEPAEQAPDAEREFNEVLKGAQEFNDALPERMRRNARDWLRPDDEPATDAEPVAWRVHAPKDDYYGVGPDTLQFHPLEQLDFEKGYSQTPLFTRPPESRLREALESLIAPFADDPCRQDHHGYCQAHFLELHCCVAKARAALAQEDGQ